MSINNIKRTVNNAKKWASRHKTEIIICGGVAVAIGIGLWSYKRMSIVEPALKSAIPKVTQVPNAIVSEPLKDTVRIITRCEHPRILPLGQKASPSKIAEAVEKGIRLRAGETLVKACPVKIKCA